jgi:hypothetical protein
MCGLLLAASGCGSGGDRPPLGQVSGTITMEGKPLEGLIVLIKPKEGRPAVGETDKNGFYRAEYLYRVPGAKVGPSIVSFEWPLAKGGPPLAEKYGPKSEIAFEVKAGSNEFSLDLEPAAPPNPRAKKVPTPE